MRKIEQILFSLFCLPLLFACKNNIDIKFDRNRWLNDDPNFYLCRRYMTNNIINDGLLINKSSFEVDSILGKPNSTDTTLAGHPIKFYYTTQLSYGFDIDCKFYKELIILVDTLTDKVSKVELYESPDRRSFIERQMSN